jgi:hypothetical protein
MLNVRNNKLYRFLFFVISKILSVKVNIVKLYYIIILLLPLIETELRIRIGAGWQLYMPLIFLLFFSILVKKKDFYNHFIIAIILILFMLISNLYGYYIYKDYPLTLDLISQIQNLEFKIIVESVRYVSVIFFFVATLYLINTRDRLLNSFKYFLYAVFYQALYGVYEILAKTILTFLPLINSKAYSHNTIRVHGTFYEPSQYGLFILIGILTLLLYKSIIDQHNYRCSNMFVKHYKKILLLFLIALILSLSRAAFLVGLALLFIYFIMSVTRVRYLLKITGLIISIFGIFVIYINLILTSGQYEHWVFLLTSDIGNGLIARIYNTIDDINNQFYFVINNILGIGEGVISLQFGMIPFIFRLAIEKGVFIFVGYAIFISSIYIKGFFYVKDKIIRTNMLLLLTGLIAIQLNYSSTNDPWIWFLFAMLFNAPLVIKRRTKVRPNFRTAT